MKTETLKIEIPKGFQVASFNEETGEIKFKPKPIPIMERLNTFADVLEFHSKTEEIFNEENQGLPSDEIGNRAEKLIVVAYNNNKLPDWSDGTAKLYPIFNMPSPSGSGFSFNGCGYWHSISIVGARLVFHGPEARAHLHDAVKKFLPQYKKSRTT